MSIVDSLQFNKENGIVYVMSQGSPIGAIPPMAYLKIATSVLQWMLEQTDKANAEKQEGKSGLVVAPANTKLPPMPEGGQ